MTDKRKKMGDRTTDMGDRYITMDGRYCGPESATRKSRYSLVLVTKRRKNLRK